MFSEPLNRDSGKVSRFNFYDENIKNNNKQMQQHSQKPMQNRKYSNLIFTSHKRSSSAPQPKNQCTQRSNSIMLLRGVGKKSPKFNFDNTMSSEQVLEMKHENKPNIINLLNGNNAMGPKIKSHYCKKITLSNLDKYYQYCVKNVKSIIKTCLDCDVNVNVRKGSGGEERKEEIVRNHNNPQNDEKIDRRNSFTAYGSRYKLQRYQIRKGIRNSDEISGFTTPRQQEDNNEKEEQPDQFVQFESSKLHDGCPCCSNRGKKMPYAFNRARFRQNSRYDSKHTPYNFSARLPKRRVKQKDQFKLNGWETPDMLQSQDIM